MAYLVLGFCVGAFITVLLLRRRYPNNTFIAYFVPRFLMGGEHPRCAFRRAFIGWWLLVPWLLMLVLSLLDALPSHWVKGHGWPWVLLQLVMPMLMFVFTLTGLYYLFRSVPFNKVLPNPDPAKVEIRVKRMTRCALMNASFCVLLVGMSVTQVVAGVGLTRPAYLLLVAVFVATVVTTELMRAAILRAGLAMQKCGEESPSSKRVFPLIDFVSWYRAYALKKRYELGTH